MMNKSEAVLIQKQIAERGFIEGTSDAVCCLLSDILYHDTRYRKVGAKYGPLAPGKRAKEGKEPGTPYEMLCLGRGPVKGVRTEAEQAARVVPNNLLTVYAVDSERRCKGPGGWRHINTRLIQYFEVYTGRRVPSTSPRRFGKMVGERVAIPVRIID